MSTQPKPQPEPAPTPIWMSVLGWIISLLPGCAFLAFGYMKLTGQMKPPPGTPDMGWNPEVMHVLTLIEIIGALLYLFPYTATLGAIILTGYLGGAVATHLRIADGFAFPFLFGLLIWLGLVLRDARLRAILPFRSVTNEPPGRSGCMGFIVLVLLTVLVVAGLIIGLTQALPDNYRIARSTTILAPPSAVFAVVSDVNRFKEWDPFGEQDPNIQLTIDGKPGEVGATYKWSGNSDVGIGMLTVKEVVPNERVKWLLEFEAPMKDTLDAEFLLKPDKHGTVGTWVVMGKSEPAHKLIRGVLSMETMIGAKFEKGLSKLKAIVEEEQRKAPPPEVVPVKKKDS